MDLNTLCNIIILIGGVVLAVTNIAKFVGKPIGFLKKKRDEEIQQQTKTILNELLPEFFEKRDEETRARYLSQREAYLHEISNEVCEKQANTLQELTVMVNELKDSVEVLKQGSKDVLRQKIMSIYHEYKQYREFPIFEKEALVELYKDYKKEGGNSYIDKYYSRMDKWEVTYPDDDIDD